MYLAPIRWTMVIVALLLPLPSATQQVIVGNCNIVMQNVKVAPGQSVRVDDIGCPQDPKKTLRVGYYWLDSNSFSLLLANAHYGPLQTLLGARPIIVPNATYIAAADLVNRFGIRIDQASHFGHADTVNVRVGQSTDEIRIELDKFFPGGTSAIKILDTSDPIYIPDFDTIEYVYSRLDWPGAWSLYYSNRGNRLTDWQELPREGNDLIGDLLIDTTVLWRPVTQLDIDRYEESMRVFQERALQKPDFIWMPPYAPRLSAGEREALEKLPVDQQMRAQAIAEIKKLPAAGRSRSLSALRYVAKSALPRDFLIAYGFAGGHAGSVSGWTIATLPRRMFVQIAVIENVGGSGAVYQVRGFSAKRSDHEDLRPASADTAEHSEFVQFTPGVLSKGEKVVIPIRIEFRQTTEWGRADAPDDLAPSSEGAAEVARLLKTIPPTAIVRTLNSTHGGTVSRLFIRKRASAFHAPTVPPAARGYLYGPRYTLAQVLVDNSPIALRQYDPNNVFIVAGFEGGSCPILYLSRANEPERVKIGRVIVHGDGPERIVTQTIELGERVETVELAEEEPERTTVREITIYRIESDGSEEVEFAETRGHSIEQGEVLRISLAPRPQGRYVMRLRGYYEPYAVLLGRRVQ